MRIGSCPTSSTLLGTSTASMLSKPRLSDPFYVPPLELMSANVSLLNLVSLSTSIKSRSGSSRRACPPQRKRRYAKLCKKEPRWANHRPSYVGRKVWTQRTYADISRPRGGKQSLCNQAQSRPWQISVPLRGVSLKVVTGCKASSTPQQLWLTHYWLDS